MERRGLKSRIIIVKRNGGKGEGRGLENVKGDGTISDKRGGRGRLGERGEKKTETRTKKRTK